MVKVCFFFIKNDFVFVLERFLIIFILFFDFFCSVDVLFILYLVYCFVVFFIWLDIVKLDLFWLVVNIFVLLLMKIILFFFLVSGGFII